MTKYAFINGAIKKCVTNCNKTTFEYVSRHEDKCVPSCADEGSKIKQGTNVLKNVMILFQFIIQRQMNV